MRVLFSSTSGYGHLYPMVPLARAFVAAGHDVLWAVGADARPHVEACAVPTAAAGLTGGALVEVRQQVFGAAGALPPPERAAYVFPRWFGSGLTGPMVDDLLPLARDWGPDLLVHEQGELAAPLVGAVLAVPSVTTSFGGFVPAEMIAAAGTGCRGCGRGTGSTCRRTPVATARSTSTSARRRSRPSPATTCRSCRRCARWR